MGYRLNRLDEPVFMTVPKPMLTEFGILYRLEIGVLSISGKRLNFLDLELKENSRKIKLLEIGLEEIKSVDTNICAQKITKPYSYPCQLYLH